MYMNLHTQLKSLNTIQCNDIIASYIVSSIKAV